MSLQGYYTNKGSALAAKVAAGTTALTITRVVAGSGHTTDIPSATTLPSIQQTLTVGSASVSGSTATLPVTLAETAATASYSLTELGVYATDPTEGEILMQVYQLSTAQDITAGGESVLRFYLRQSIGALGVTVTCSSAGMLIDSDLDPIRAAIQNIPGTLRTDKTLYVSPSGSDTTGDGSSDSPFRTVQHAIDSVPKMLDNAKVKIILRTGTYHENVEIKGFAGGGEFEMCREASAYVEIDTIHISRCSVPVIIQSVHIISYDSTKYWCVFVEDCAALVQIKNIYCQRTSEMTEYLYGAVTVRGGTIVLLTNSYIQNYYSAIACGDGAIIATWGNIINATVALRCGGVNSNWAGGIIFNGANTLSGTTTTQWGGQIWS